ncbi:MAG TPA: hypothetical protein VI636_12815, partial [Candidatus Angelobacter sp.]
EPMRRTREGGSEVVASGTVHVARQSVTRGPPTGAGAAVPTTSQSPYCKGLLRFAHARFAV